MTRQKKLIINADDFGMAPSFNKGTLELVDMGIVTSTTVMIRRKFVDAKKLLRCKNLSIGLHLVLPLESSGRHIEEQIAAFQKKFKQLPSHLDGHQYYHLLPSNFPKVIKIAKKYGLPVRSASSVDRNILKQAGIKTPDQYFSWHPERKKKMFGDLVHSRAKVSELVCHPGYSDSKVTYKYNKQREAELKIMKSSAFQTILKNFKLINYNDL
jgi:chitin disaccharide deacetylase